MGALINLVFNKMNYEMSMKITLFEKSKGPPIERTEDENKRRNMKKLRNEINWNFDDSKALSL